MKTFQLSCDVTVSAFTSVEAETLEEAIKAAEDREVVIAGVGSGADEDSQWIIEEADGTPNNIHAMGE